MSTELSVISPNTNNGINAKRSIQEILADTGGLDDNPPPKKQRVDSDKKDNGNVEIKNKLLNSGEPIILNVGGVKYSTSLSTLSVYTNSILYKMFAGNFSLKPTKDGSYFIDRDGKYFEYILNYLRNYKLNIPNDIYIIDHLLLEADYYGLSSFKNSLLFQKSPLSSSKILTQKDVDFIQQRLDSLYDQSECVLNCSLIHEGHMIDFGHEEKEADYAKFKGKQCLLFLMDTKQKSKFGFYVRGHYINGRTMPIKGFAFDLDSYITGEHCIQQMYSTNVLLGYGYEEDSILYWLGDSAIQIGIQQDSRPFNTVQSWDDDGQKFDGIIKRIEVYQIN